jgi:hypothetical protein
MAFCWGLSRLCYHLVRVLNWLLLAGNGGAGGCYPANGANAAAGSGEHPGLQYMFVREVCLDPATKGPWQCIDSAIGSTWCIV